MREDGFWELDEEDSDDMDDMLAMGADAYAEFERDKQDKMFDEIEDYLEDMIMRYKHIANKADTTFTGFGRETYNKLVNEIEKEKLRQLSPEIPYPMPIVQPEIFDGVILN
jgi:hypothetical protein